MTREPFDESRLLAGLAFVTSNPSSFLDRASSIFLETPGRYRSDELIAAAASQVGGELKHVQNEIAKLHAEEASLKARLNHLRAAQRT